MVKVYGPMMSLDASGTLARALAFSKWKGRNYVRERVTPSNPNSGAQLGRRAMWSFLTQEWASIPDDQKPPWQDSADELVASRFNAYLSHNMSRWHNFKAPGWKPPIQETGTLGTYAVQPWAIWQVNRIQISCVLMTVGTNWGTMIFASPTGTFDTAVANCILVRPTYDTDAKLWYWTPPAVQTWYFDTRLFTSDGKLGPENSEFSAAP